MLNLSAIAMLPPETLHLYERHFVETIQSLVCLPRAQPRESFSSWVTRAAISQACEFAEFAELLKLDRWGDLDLASPLLLTNELLQMPQLRELRAAKVAVVRLHANGLPQGELLCDDRKNPRYRFCPMCLAEASTPSLAISWRRADLRYCLRHRCLLEDDCGACGAAIELPGCMLTAGRRMSGVGDLSLCLKCGEEVFRKPPIRLKKRFLRRFRSASAGWCRTGPLAIPAALGMAGVAYAGCPGFIEMIMAKRSLHSPDIFRTADVRAECKRMDRGRKIGARWLRECDWYRLGARRPSPSRPSVREAQGDPHRARPLDEGHDMTTPLERFRVLAGFPSVLAAAAADWQLQQDLRERAIELSKCFPDERQLRELAESGRQGLPSDIAQILDAAIDWLQDLASPTALSSELLRHRNWAARHFPSRADVESQRQAASHSAGVLWPPIDEWMHPGPRL